MSGADRLRLTGGSVGYPAGHYEELLLLFVVHVVEIIVAYNDSRRLKQRGVPYPFGWGWTFLGGLVYAIGRAVIVRRRTGSGLLPLWIYLAIFVVADVTEFSVSFGNVSG